MKFMKSAIRRLARQAGYDIVPRRHDSLGVSPFADIQRLLKGNDSPLVFDVGANVGQSVIKFKDWFPKAIVHSFEPSPTTYEKLQAAVSGLTGVTTWNYGVGSAEATLTLKENDHSDMSSFLLPGSSGWGRVIKSTDVAVITLDKFAASHGIDFIHVLKSDTQGFDFEVLKGAERLMLANRIGLIYFEFTFSAMYEGSPRFDEVFRYLSERGFGLVASYEQHFQGDFLGWTDFLFMSRGFNPEVM